MPALQSLAEQFLGRARVAKVSTDKDGRILESFEASGYPTYIVFRDGIEVDRLTLSFAPWLIETRLRWMIEGAL